MYPHVIKVVPVLPTLFLVLSQCNHRNWMTQLCIRLYKHLQLFMLILVQKCIHDAKTDLIAECMAQKDQCLIRIRQNARFLWMVFVSRNYISKQHRLLNHNKILYLEQQTLLNNTIWKYTSQYTMFEIKPICQTLDLKFLSILSAFSKIHNFGTGMLVAKCQAFIFIGPTNQVSQPERCDWQPRTFDVVRIYIREQFISYIFYITQC